MEEDTEYLKLSTEDKCQHKLWKARLKGYEEATRLFQQLDEKAPEFNRYAPLIKKFVADSNAVAQEKGLEAALVFLENAHLAGRVCGDVLAGVVAKAIAAPKTSTRDKARQLVLMAVEIEKQELVQEELCKGFSHKNPKVVAACIGGLTLALSSFGHTIVNLKPLIKLIPSIMENKDKMVREEAKALIVELHRWIGAAIKPHLNNLKPVQVTELEAEFARSAGERPRQSRWLRSQQEQQRARQEVAEDEAESAGEDDEPAAIDPLDLLEPVNTLAQLPKEFHQLTEAKKWQERKQALESLHELVTKNPRLETGDYGDVVKDLKRVITKDTNVMLVALAGQCLAGLAAGLKRSFAPYAVVCISAIIEKFKEKKTNVVSALRDAADAIYPSTSLEALQEDVFGGLNNKNPSVKSETAYFVARAFCYCTPTILTKKLLKAYSTELVKLLADSDPSVRDRTAEALGTAWKVVGEKAIMPFIADIDALKLAKVKEASEKAEIKVRISAPKSAPAAAPGRAKVVRSGGATAAAAAGKKPTRPASKRAAANRAGSAPATARVEETEPELSDEEAALLVADLLSEETIQQLSDANWKSRLAASETLHQVVSGRSDLPTQALLKVLSRKPGLKDNNFQVLKMKFDVVLQLAEHAKFTRRCADVCLSDLVDKLGDVKTGSAASAALVAIAEAVGLEPVSSDVLQLAFAHKSPKVQENALGWLAKNILEFGFVVKPKPIVNYVRKALSHTSPSVRNAAIALLGTMHLYMGATLRQLFEDEKPALLQQIDAEIERVSADQPPPPTRGVKSSGGTGDASGQAVPSEGAAQRDMVPREDIADQVTPALLSELADKNWKVRNEALQKISDMLREAKFVTASIGELGSALAVRCTDSNKNLAAEALRICGVLGGALGPHCKAHVRTVVPGVLSALGDIKPNIRQSAVATLNIWIEHTSFRDFCDGEMLADALKTGTPNTRAELFSWMAAQMKEVAGPLPKEDVCACLPHLYTSLEDRSADVRRAASEALLPFMIHIGYDAMARSAGKLKPASSSTVMAALEKERPNLPAKAPAKSRAGAPAAKVVRSGGGMRAAASQDSLDDEEPAAPPTTRQRAGKPQRHAAKGRVNTFRAGKEDPDADLSPLLQINNLKRQRVSDELKLKCLKWNFSSPRPEFLEQLKDQMTNAGVNKTLMTNMFNPDFKQHIKAIDSLSARIDTNFEALSCNLDMLLKWMTLRFFDTNPTVIIKGLEMFLNIFMVLADNEYRLLDQEASAFIPYLIVKLGDPKDTIRASVRNIFRELYKIHPASKVFTFVMDGLKSKNGRQRAECLEELGYMIEKNALGVCQPSVGVAMKEVARQIGDRDHAVRKAALNTLVQAHYQAGDRLYKLVGNISAKDMSLLEERIKRAPPAPVAAAAPATAARPQSCVEPSSRAADNETPPPKTRPHSDVPAAASPGGASPPGQEIQRPRNELTEYAEALMQRLPRLPVGSAIDDDFMDNWRRVLGQMDDIINEPPVVLPSFRHSWSKARSQFHTSELQLWVSQVMDPDPPTVHRGVERLMTVLKSNEPDELLELVNQLLAAANTQFERLLATLETPGAEPSVALCKDVVSMLTTLFHYPSLSDQCSVAVLQQLLGTLLSITTSGRLAKKTDSGITSAINKITVGLVDKANHTNLICALVQMLHDSVKTDAGGSDYQTLLMKCIWKAVRLMPEWTHTLDVAAILLHIHKFFVAFPGASWKTRASDTPLRTVKTVLHTLATIFGYVVLTKIGRIENAHKSELMAYLVKVVTSTGGQPTLKATASAPAASGEHSHSNATSSPGSHNLSKITRDQLSDIFKKIGSKENTKEGLMQLYEFKQQHADADIQSFLSKSSKFFQNYVERGLKNIESERQRSGGWSRAVPADDRGRVWEQEEAAIQEGMKRIEAQLPPAPTDCCSEDAAEAYGDRLRAIVRMWPGSEQLLDEIDTLVGGGRPRTQSGQGVYYQQQHQQQQQLQQQLISPPATVSGMVSGSHQQPVADAAEIEEYRRRLAKFRKS